MVQMDYFSKFVLLHQLL